MSGTPTTFQSDILTRTIDMLAMAEDIKVHALWTEASDPKAIATTHFLSASDQSFYQSDAYSRVITNKNPPSYSSYAKDPGGELDDSYDVNLLYSKWTTLAEGQTQKILNGDRSVMVAGQNAYTTVEGNCSVAYGGTRMETIQGKLNQKVYNGEKAIYNADSTRFYDAPVLVYEHQNVEEHSMANDTVVHFGQRTVLRKGDETDLVHGNTYSTVFGSEVETHYGDASEIIIGDRNLTIDHTINLKTVTGLRSEFAIGLEAAATIGIATALNLFAVVVAVREDLIAVFDGKVMGIKLKSAVEHMEKYGFVGKVIGLCLRGTAGVFGIIRA